MSESSGGVGSSPPIIPVPQLPGRFVPSWAILHPPVTSDTVEFSPENMSTGMDPFEVTNKGWNNFLSSPLLAIAALVGAGGVLVGVIATTHRITATNGVAKSFEKGFRDLDKLLLPNNGMDAAATKRAFESEVERYIEKYAKTGTLPAIIGRKGPSAYLGKTLQTQEKALNEIKRLLDTHPGNEAALAHLYQHLQDNKQLEVRAQVILGRLAEINKSHRAGVGNLTELTAQKIHLEALCAELVPGYTGTGASNELAKRYLLSQMPLIEGIQGIPHSQGNLLRLLQELHESRQKTIIRCLPTDEAFWNAQTPSGTQIANQLKYAQNLMFRSHRDVLSHTRRFRRDWQNAENAVHRSLEEFYLHLSRTGVHRLPTRNPLRRTGRVRSTAHP